jgi:hypothetical protein
MWRNSFKSQKWNLRQIWSRQITAGRATVIGTKYFLEQAKLPMIHTLKKSKLNIHPLILHPPMHPEANKEGLDSLYDGAVLKYRTNCLHVYSRDSKGKVWYTKAVQDLVEAGVDREGLVTIANIGKVAHRDELLRVLEEAWSLTDQEFIDVITLEVQPSPALAVCLPSEYFSSSSILFSTIKIGKKVISATIRL